MGGPGRVVTGPTWGGCLEVLQWILPAGHFPQDPAVLEGAILLVETSESCRRPGKWDGSRIR